MILMFLISRTWYDYYPNVIYQNKSTTQRISSGGNFWIKFLNFENIANSAICLENQDDSTKHLLISETRFKNCSNKNQSGGAIRFLVGQIIQEKVCDYGSWVPNSSELWGSHSFTQSTADSGANYIFQSSLVKCNGCWSTIWMMNGFINLSKSNISYNDHKYNSAITIDGGTVLVDYCTITNNKGNKINSHQKTTQNVQFCNIIDNDDLSEQYGLVQSDGCQLTYYHCDFNSNTVKNYLFYCQSGKLIIDSCSYPIRQKLYSCTTKNSIYFKTSLYHLNTAECSGRLPERTPFPSPSKSPKRTPSPSPSTIPKRTPSSTPTLNQVPTRTKEPSEDLATPMKTQDIVVYLYNAFRIIRRR